MLNCGKIYFNYKTQLRISPFDVVMDKTEVKLAAKVKWKEANYYIWRDVIR